MTWNILEEKKFDLFFGICATIRKRRGIQCLPYQQFLVISFEPDQEYFAHPPVHWVINELLPMVFVEQPWLHRVF